MFYKSWHRDFCRLWVWIWETPKAGASTQLTLSNDSPWWSTGAFVRRCDLVYLRVCSADKSFYLARSAALKSSYIGRFLRFMGLALFCLLCHRECGISCHVAGYAYRLMSMGIHNSTTFGTSRLSYTRRSRNVFFNRKYTMCCNYCLKQLTKTFLCTCADFLQYWPKILQTNRVGKEWHALWQDRPQCAAQPP